jgi:hypothetical protein
MGIIQLVIKGAEQLKTQAPLNNVFNTMFTTVKRLEI